MVARPIYLEIFALYLTFTSLSCSGDRAGFSGSDKKKSPVKEPPAATPMQISVDHVAAQNPIEASASSDIFIGGSEEVFHIGDGHLDPGTACFKEVVGSSLTGTTYIFSFTVTEDGTQTSISVEKICGMDVNNTLSVSKNGVVFDTKPLFPGMASYNLTPTPVLLDRGLYEIFVISTKQKKLFSHDYDDFLVGKVHVSANKSTIVSGGVRTQ